MVLIKKKKYPMTRSNWIIQMYDFGENGVKDFNTTAKKIISPTKNLIKKTSYGLKLKKLDPTLDVEGYDKPRDDIKNIHLKNGKIVRVGGDNIESNIKTFKKYILPYINKSFTKEELKNLDTYIEYPSKKLIKGNFGGMSDAMKSNKNKKISIIELLDTKNKSVAIHEIIHAIKHANNNIIHSVHKDEAETILEEHIRLPPKVFTKKSCDDSYYSFIKGNKCKAVKEDIEIIKSNCNIKNKKGLTKCITKNLKKTNIGKIKIPKSHIPKQ